MSISCGICYQSKCSNASNCRVECKHWSINLIYKKTISCFSIHDKLTNFEATCNCGCKVNLAMSRNIQTYKCSGKLSDLSKCSNQLVYTQKSNQLTNLIIHNQTQTLYPRSLCQSCRSTGLIDQTHYNECINCKGKGTIDKGHYKPCPQCRGKYHIGGYCSCFTQLFSKHPYKFNPKCQLCKGSLLKTCRYIGENLYRCEEGKIWCRHDDICPTCKGTKLTYEGQRLMISCSQCHLINNPV